MERWAVPATPDSEDGRLSTPGIPEDFVYEELLTRTSWTNAEYAFRQVERGRAQGNKAALWLRSKLQGLLFTLGCYLQLHSGKGLFLGLVILGACAVGLKLTRIETNVEKLWVQVGGRLEKELEYTEATLGSGWGATSQIIVQTPKKQGENILTQTALLQHVRSAVLATQVEVDMYGVTWSFKDLCYITEYPSFEDLLIDSIIENIIPCTIITPLDCFWEGAKLLGPESPIHIPNYNKTLRWTSLDPLGLLKLFEGYEDYFSPEAFEDIINRTGIGHAYQVKPCLNPQDQECPDMAPNKQSGEIPDIASQLTGGCAGFASRYMQWPEELIVGGVTKNESGVINSGEALQTVIQLRGEKDMYEAWKNHIKVDEIRWTEDKARSILEEWQRKFTNVVRNSTMTNSTQDVNALSSASLNDLLKDFSQTSVVRVAMGYAIMVMYATLTMMKLYDGVLSQGGLGLFGVLLVAGSVSAGLGFCALIGIVFNASTTQVLPFLALGVGVDDMFLLAHTSTSIPSEIPLRHKTGEILRRAGVSVILTSVNNICAFLAAAIIPIPALRSLAFQLVIVLTFNLLVMLLVFPAMLALDVERREAKRVDLFCCIQSEHPHRLIRVQPRPLCGGSAPYRESPLPRQYPRHTPGRPLDRTDITLHSTVQTVTHASGEPGDACVTEVHPSASATRDRSVPHPAPAHDHHHHHSASPSTTTSMTSVRTLLRSNSDKTAFRDCMKKLRFWRWNISEFVRDYYAPFIQRTSVKISVLILFACLLGASVYGVVIIEDGLEITDVVPRETREEDFLATQARYFSFYNMYAVTQEDFDYARRQKQLHAFHGAFADVPEIIRQADGSLPTFWLETFREWLQEMQEAFDADKRAYSIKTDRWYPNATDKGVIAYKMILQTGIPESPADTNRYYTGRLVDEHGVIYPDAFYNYLTVWYNYDTISYTASAGNLHPTPPSWTPVGKADLDVTIPKSQALNYTQLPFYLNNLNTTQDVVRVIKAVRNISDYYEGEGLPNYPLGVPFTFWEQYIHLRFYLALSLVSLLGASFIIITLMLVNPWASLILVFVLGMITVELFGFMGLIGLKLSAIPAATLIVSVGIGVEFTLHTCYAFLTAIGDRERRVTMALEHTFSPVLDGAVSTLLGVVMLAGAEFDFIVSYFFYVFLALIILGTLNGLVLLPVLLSLFGPPAEVRPPDNANRLPTPTPPPTPPTERVARLRHRPAAWDDAPHSGSYPSMVVREDVCGDSGEHIQIHPPEVVVETMVHHPHLISEATHGLPGHQDSPIAQRTRSHRSTSKYPRRHAHHHHHHPHHHPHHQYPHHHHQTRHQSRLARQAFPFSTNPHSSTSSSSSGSTPADSPHLARHVTTVTATARVSIVHGAACTVLADEPRHQKRRRRPEEGKDALEREVKLECIEGVEEPSKGSSESNEGNSHQDSTV
ncbi:protein patched homolog 1-like [Diadema setosum]|uniref:protein patched homolog 1-like n=1 Tax=Diadema setosum TaxID=31175 RepID=UPI003B3A90E6